MKKEGDIIISKSETRALTFGINKKLLPMSKRSTPALTSVMNLKISPMSKRSQVWVETVIYTLIALTIIGLFISFAKPKIEEIQDKATIDQSVQMMEDINSIISSIVQGGAGNQRVVEVGIKKGELRIDGTNDEIIFEMDGKYAYTQPGENGMPGEYINVGNILASTKKIGKISTVTLISNYSNRYDLQFDGVDKVKAVTKAPVAYQISFSNKGDSGGKTLIDIGII